MALKAKTRAKNRSILANQKTKEPEIDTSNFNLSLGTALSNYSQNTTSKEQKQYAIEFFSKKEPKIAKSLRKLPEWQFTTFGSLCRLMTKNQLDVKTLTSYSPWFTNKLKELLDIAEKIEEKVDSISTTNVVNIQDRINEKASELIADIEGEIDEFCKTYTTSFSAKNFLSSKQVSAPIAKRIADFYVGLSEELHETIKGKDEQLNEGYSHLTKKQLKKYSEFIDGIILDCNQMVQSAKATRAAPKRKTVTPQKLVSKMKFMREFADLKLKSCNAVDIIGSSELWVYNTKYRKITVYKAESGALSVKGTTVLGFSVSESKTLMLRKPEEFFKGLSFGKRALNSAIKSIKTKPTSPNGRVNEDCILLGAF